MERRKERGVTVLSLCNERGVVVVVVVVVVAVVVAAAVVLLLPLTLLPTPTYPHLHDPVRGSTTLVLTLI